MKVVMYSKSFCPYCVNAEKWLNAKGFEFEKIVIDDDNERKAFYERVGSNIRTMPQIFVDDVRIGGYDDLVKSGIDKIKEINLDSDF